MTPILAALLFFTPTAQVGNAITDQNNQTITDQNGQPITE